MAIRHIAVLGAALLVLTCLPYAVGALGGVDRRAVPRAWVRRAWWDTWFLRRLDRRLRGAALLPAPGGTLQIEALAAELRRLDRQRRSGPTTCSQRWLNAVVRAYDERLRLASRCLGVAEHLDELAGVDRDLERMRVEAELESVGLSLRARS